MATVPSIGRAQPGLRLVPGAADAARDLYERYGAQILRFCLRELGNREEAEDAAQTTFLNAFRGLERGVAPEFESAWLHTIAHRVCASRKRSAWRRGRVESPDDLDAIQEVVPARATDGDELFGLRDALEALPEQQRRALLLREWQGLSCKEIGAELGLSSSAVEMLLFRARRGVVHELTAEPPPQRRSLRGRLRTSGDLGSIVAAIKTLLLTGGTKVVATLATVAASTVVAATPATRHEIVAFVAPPAQHVVAKAPRVRNAVAPAANAVAAVVSGAAVVARPAHAEAKAHAPVVRRKALAHTSIKPARRFGVSAHRVSAPPAHPHPAPSTVKAPAAPATAAPAVAPSVTSTPSDADTTTTPADAGATPATAPAPAAPAPVATPSPQPVAVPAATVAPVAPVAKTKPPPRAAVAPAPSPAPSLAAFSPAGAGVGETVKVTGADLSGATSVTFNGVPAQFKVDNDSQLKATVPGGATSGPIAVTGPTGTGTSAGSFAVAPPAAPAPAPPTGKVSHTPVVVPVPPVTVAPPVVVSIPAPSVGSIAPASATAGTWVTISGSALSGASSVSFNGAPSSFTVTSDTQIAAQVPGGATSGRVAVTTPSGTATSTATFTVAVAAPSVSAFAPSSAVAGASVSITGSHLTGTSAVSFNGVPASFVIVSDTQLTAQVPVAATSGAIVVTTPGGTATSAAGFAILAPPAVTGLSPSAGQVGSQIFIAGTNLSGATLVTLNGVAAKFVVVSDSQLVAEVPHGATSGPLAVTTPNGTATAPVSYTVTSGGGKPDKN